METNKTVDAIALSERRRMIFERTKARYAAAGVTFDDPEHLALIGKWISGEIRMPDAAEQWDTIRKARARSRHRNATPHPSDLAPRADQENMLADLAQQSE